MILNEMNKMTSEYLIDSTPKVTKCDDKRCETCKQIVVGSQVVVSKPNKTPFDVKNKIDCGVSDFIYVKMYNFFFYIHLKT